MFWFPIQSDPKLSFCLLKMFERQIYVKQTPRHTDVQSDTHRCLVEACPFFLAGFANEAKEFPASCLYSHARYQIVGSGALRYARPAWDPEKCQQDCAHLARRRSALTRIHACTRHFCLYAHQHTCTLMRAPDKLSHLHRSWHSLSLPC